MPIHAKGIPVLFTYTPILFAYIIIFFTYPKGIPVEH